MPIGDEAINVFMGMPGEDPRPRADLQPRGHRVRERHRLQPHRPRRRRPRRHPGEARRRRDRAREAALPPRRPHRGPPDRIRPRPGRLPDRAHRRVVKSGPGSRRTPRTSYAWFALPLALASLLVGGCGESTGDAGSREKFDPGPKGALAAARGYLDALLEGNAEAACSYFPPEALQDAPGCEAAFEAGFRGFSAVKTQELKETRSELSIDDVSISGNVATVEVEAEDLVLVAIGGAWYVTSSD